MHEFIYTRAKENILSSSIGCFIKGTLVKIPGGWKPIDELKVGDWVMSRPENGIGEAVAKKVVNTFRFENKEIWHVGISDDDLRRGFSTYEFAVTPNHPFCVYGVATNLYFPDNPELTHEWEQFSVQQYEEYRYDDYYDDETGEQILYSALHTYMQDDDTEEFKAFRSSPYEITLFDTPVWKRADQLEWGDVLLGTFNNYCVVELSRPYAAVPGSEWAWLADDKRRVTWQKEPLGHYIEFNLDSERFYKPAKVKNKNGFWFYTRNDEGLIRQDADGTRHYLPYLATVYNIEVEDYHTYCVGYEGFLVHNDNCGISRRDQLNLKIRSKNGSDAWMKEMLKKKNNSWKETQAAVQGRALLVDDQMSLIIKTDEEGRSYTYNYTIPKSGKFAGKQVYTTKGSPKQYEIQFDKDGKPFFTDQYGIDHKIKKEGKYAYTVQESDGSAGKKFHTATVENQYLIEFDPVTNYPRYQDKAGRRHEIERIYLDEHQGSAFDNAVSNQYRAMGALYHAAEADKIKLLSFALPFRNPFVGGKNSIAMGDLMVFAKNAVGKFTNTFADIKLGMLGWHSGSAGDYLKALEIYESNLKRAEKLKSNKQRTESEEKELSKIQEKIEAYKVGERGLSERTEEGIIDAFKNLIRANEALKFHGDKFNHVYLVQGSAEDLAKFFQALVDDPYFIRKVTEKMMDDIDGFQVKSALQNGSYTLSPNLYIAEFGRVDGINKDDRLGIIDGAPIYSFQGKHYQSKPVDMDKLPKLIENDFEYKEFINELKEKIAEGVDVRKQEVLSAPLFTDKPVIDMFTVTTLLPAAKQYWLEQGADAHVLDGIHFTVSENVPNHLAAYTQGNNITLSANGAGYGWFVDSTPETHEEFTARTDSYSFTAANGEVARRLDLLTVLIHEMGHILNVGHRLDNDVMTNMLSAGERRLPNAQDALHLQYLNGTRYYTPPMVPLTRTWFAEPVNAILSNRDFAQGLNGWQQMGALLPEKNSVWLNEISGSHTRLAQAFKLDAGKRVLHFTLDKQQLSDNGGGQAPDAFEAALLDAATGETIFHSGLNGSDSLLNIQSDGSETLAQTIRRIYNRDGSRSYYLDLSAYWDKQTAAGQAAEVWLSFDLLGFGAADSKVRISNIGLSEILPAQPIQVTPDTPTPKHPSQPVSGNSTTANGNQNTSNPSTNTPLLPKQPDHRSTSTGNAASDSRTAMDWLPDAPQTVQNILTLLTHHTAASGQWLLEQSFIAPEGQQYALKFAYQVQASEPILFKIYQGSRLIRQFTVANHQQGKLTVPLTGTGYADFIRIYAERIPNQTDNSLMPLPANSTDTGFTPQIMLSANTADTLSGSQKLGWLALAAALLLVLAAQYQGYPLLPFSQRKQQLWLAGLPVGSTLSDGQNHFTATAKQQKIDISDWQTNSLQLNIAPDNTTDIRLLLTVIRPKLVGSTSRQHEFVLNQHGGYEVWVNREPFNITNKQQFKASGSHIYLNLSHIIHQGQDTDESWMRRAEQQLAKTWTLFKGK